jgi:hypothetical protein
MSARCTLYLTYYSEYLVQGEVCVGVRDRRSGLLQPLHAATRAYVLGAQTTLHSSPLVGDAVRIGERLCLLTSACRIVTGPIVAIETPSPRLIEEAASRWQSAGTESEPQGCARSRAGGMRSGG